MRNMSFMLTEDQMRSRTKSVTRRRGWRFLKVGDKIMACVKCQGLGKGGKIERIGVIQIITIRREALSVMSQGALRDARLEARLEGFPELTNHEFVCMFCRHMKCQPGEEVTRIGFKFL